MEETRSEAVLELCDLMAHRALADAKFDRRSGEIEMACCGFEGTERVNGQLGTVHAKTLVYLMALSRNRALSMEAVNGILGPEGRLT